jgi:hypothetical protein
MRQIFFFKKTFVLLFFVLTQSKITKEKSRLTGIFCKSYDLIFFPENELTRPLKIGLAQTPFP